MDPDRLIFCATLAETAGFTGFYPPDRQQTTRSGLSLFSGTMGRNTYDLLISGPGVFNAAHALTAYLERSRPAVILQIGIAGVFRESGFDIGDVAVAEEEIYIHAGVAADGPVNRPLPFDLIASMPSTREGRYPFDESRVAQIHDRLLRILDPEGIRVGKGRFLTVSAVTGSFEQAARVHAALSPVMEAMEGAAAAHVAALYRVPMVEVRAASNIVGERDKSRWDGGTSIRNLGLACAAI